MVVKQVAKGRLICFDRLWIALLQYLNFLEALANVQVYSVALRVMKHTKRHSGKSRKVPGIFLSQILRCLMRFARQITRDKPQRRLNTDRTYMAIPFVQPSQHPCLTFVNSLGMASSHPRPGHRTPEFCINPKI